MNQNSQTPTDNAVRLSLDAAAYQGLAGAITHIIEPETEADSAAVLIQFLAAFGNVAGRHQYFGIAGARHYANLYVVLVGKSSKGRKGTSWAYTKRTYDEADALWSSTRVMSNMSTGEGIIWAVRDPIFKTKDVLKAGNPTGERAEHLEDAGIEDKRLFVQEAEFVSVLRVMSRDGNTLSSTIRQAWDAGDLRIMTKNSPAQATGAHLSIVGHITADELRRHLDATESGNGFGNRFLWVWVERSKILPEGGNQPQFGTLLNQLRQAIEYSKRPRRVTWADDALALWRNVYPDLSCDRYGLTGALTSRAEAQVLRLALIYALLDRSDAIQQPHLHAALAVWEYCESSVQHIFGDAIGDSVADTLIKALREKRPDGMSVTDISYKLFQRNQKAARINSALTLLKNANLVRMEAQQTNGRASEVWYAC